MRTAEALRTPVDRLICEPAGSRPTIPAEYQIDWSKVLVPGDAQATLANAKAEQGKYVASIRTREGVIVGYIMQVEGKLFTCSNNMQWRRDYEAQLPTTQ